MIRQCINGPYHSLSIKCNAKQTFTFTVGGFTGSYCVNNHGKFVWKDK